MFQALLNCGKRDSSAWKPRIRMKSGQGSALLATRGAIPWSTRYWAATLQRTLSSNQLHRLDQLLLQMRGPVIILEDTNLCLRLNFSNEQLEHLAQIDNSYSPALGLLRHRFVGLEMNPVRKRSASDVNAEMEDLTRVIKEMERDRDFEFFGVWDRLQRKLWGELVGQPLDIEWGPESFSDVPFQE